MASSRELRRLIKTRETLEKMLIDEGLDHYDGRDDRIRKGIEETDLGISKEQQRADERERRERDQERP